MDADGSYSFVKIPGIPVHVNLRMSEILKAGIDEFDFSVCSGNIVHRIYDVEVDRVDETRILQRISDNSPYEELSPDYELMFTSGSCDDRQVMESITAIKTSKMEYLHRYVDRMNEEDLGKRGIDKRRLFGILGNYYDMAEEAS